MRGDTTMLRSNISLPLPTFISHMYGDEYWNEIVEIPKRTCFFLFPFQHFDVSFPNHGGFTFVRVCSRGQFIGIVVSIRINPFYLSDLSRSLHAVRYSNVHYHRLSCMFSIPPTPQFIEPVLYFIPMLDCYILRAVSAPTATYFVSPSPNSTLAIL